MLSLIIGLLAGTLCTISFIPQAIKIFKAKQAKDLSLPTFVMFSLGVFLWLVYGIVIRALPIILTNVACFILAVSIVVMKIRYDR